MAAVKHAACSFFISLIAIGDATAATRQKWEFVYVSRSTRFDVAHGQGALDRNGHELSGRLTDSQTREFRIKVKISGNMATATFGSVESDDGGTQMHGTFRQRQIAGNTGCWQTIQLSDGFSSVALARNVPRCD